MGKGSTYCPYFSPTLFAAFSTLSSELTSMTTRSAVPGRCFALRDSMAARPFASERAPMRMVAVGDSRRRVASAKPMPVFAWRRLVVW